MNILDILVGKPIKTSDERAEQIGTASAVIKPKPMGFRTAATSLRRVEGGASMTQYPCFCSLEAHWSLRECAIVWIGLLPPRSRAKLQQDLRGIDARFRKQSSNLKHENSLRRSTARYRRSSSVNVREQLGMKL
jgi:hypothetical protein